MDALPAGLQFDRGLYRLCVRQHQGGGQSVAEESEEVAMVSALGITALSGKCDSDGDINLCANLGS